MTSQSLSSQEESLAKKLYEEFFEKHPTLKNPTDINTPEKAAFMAMKGFENIRLMQKARKQKYDFTRHEEDDEVD